VDQRGLVVRAREGDHEAFTALVDLTIARLDTAARLILRERERACPVDPVGRPLVLIETHDEAVSVVPMPRVDDFSWQRRAP
jgi:hypothetical protein